MGDSSRIAKSVSVTQNAVLAKTATQAVVRICSFYDGKLQKVLEDGRRLWLSRVWALYWYASHSLTAPARVPQFMADGQLYSTESSPHILTCQ